MLSPVRTAGSVLLASVGPLTVVVFRTLRHGFSVVAYRHGAGLLEGDIQVDVEAEAAERGDFPDGHGRVPQELLRTVIVRPQQSARLGLGLEPTGQPQLFPPPVVGCPVGHVVDGVAAGGGLHLAFIALGVGIASPLCRMREMSEGGNASLRFFKVSVGMLCGGALEAIRHVPLAVVL